MAWWWWLIILAGIALIADWVFFSGKEDGDPDRALAPLFCILSPLLIILIILWPVINLVLLIPRSWWGLLVNRETDLWPRWWENWN